MSLFLSDVTISGHNEVQLWGVRGIPDRLYPTKIAAEAAARATFPADPDRYSRIYFTTFVPQD